MHLRRMSLSTGRVRLDLFCLLSYQSEQTHLAEDVNLRVNKEKDTNEINDRSKESSLKVSSKRRSDDALLDDEEASSPDSPGM